MGFSLKIPEYEGWVGGAHMSFLLSHSLKELELIAIIVEVAPVYGI